MEKKRIKDQRGIALVIALVILLMLSVVGAASILLTSTEVKISANERTSIKALYAADAGINHAMTILRGKDFSNVLATYKHGPDDTTRTEMLASVNEFLGEGGVRYNVYVRNNKGDTGPDSTTTDRDGRLILFSVAELPSGAKKIIEAEVLNPAAQLSIQAPLGLTGQFSKIKLGGNATINGDLIGEEATATNGAACNENKAGIAVSDTNTLNDIKVKKKTIHQITGGGLQEPSIQLRPADMSPEKIQALANQLAQKADRTITVDKKLDGKVDNDAKFWGTPTHPQVTVINFTSDKAKIHFNGNTTGYGVLIINSDDLKKGKIHFGGNFEWHGLIIVTGEAKLDLKMNGDAKIYGGLILANTASDTSEEQFKFKEKGNTLIQYSCSAITQATRHSPWTINAWHELEEIPKTGKNSRISQG